MMKNYLLELLTLCSDEQFGQDAIEWAILSGHVQLTYHREADLRLILGQPGHPETGEYDAMCDAYRAHCRQQEAANPLEELSRAA